MNGSTSEDRRRQTRYYARWSWPYAAFTRWVLPLTRARRALADALPREEGALVVEMGCGTGANLPHVHEALAPSASIVALDLTAAMLTRARSLVRRRGWSNVHLVQADALDPPLRPPADAVYSSFVVGAMPDAARAVVSWARLVRPGGRLVLLDAYEALQAGPLNTAFHLFVEACYPRGAGRASGRTWRALCERNEAARAALGGIGCRIVEERFVGGLVRLTVADVG